MPPVLAGCAGLGCVCSTGVDGHGGEVGVSRGQEEESCALHRTGSAHVCWIDLRLCLVTKFWGLGLVGTRIQ